MRVKLPSLTSGSKRVPRRGEGVDNIGNQHYVFPIDIANELYLKYFSE